MFGYAIHNDTAAGQGSQGIKIAGGGNIRFNGIILCPVSLPGFYKESVRGRMFGQNAELFHHTAGHFDICHAVCTGHFDFHILFCQGSGD